MSIQPVSRLVTREQYLEFDRQSGDCKEYIFGEIVPMVDVTVPESPQRVCFSGSGRRLRRAGILRTAMIHLESLSSEIPMTERYSGIEGTRRKPA